MTPSVDVIEDQTGITLLADLPGLTKENVQIQIEGDTLIIEGGLTLNMPEGMEVTHIEVGLNRFRRTFTLSKELDTEKISAELNLGVLKMRIPKVEQIQPQPIRIKVL